MTKMLVTMDEQVIFHTKTALAVHNESKKHKASMCNTIAGGVTAAGVLNPIVIVYSSYFRSMDEGNRATVAALAKGDLLSAPNAAANIMGSTGLGTIIFAIVLAVPYFIAARYIHLNGLRHLAEMKSEEEVKRGVS